MNGSGSACAGNDRVHLELHLTYPPVPHQVAMDNAIHGTRLKKMMQPLYAAMPP
jgi:hypothetical protein